MQQKGEKNSKEPKVTIPKGRVLYEVGGTPFVIDERYEIIKQIGSGAYGVVASALDREKNRKVAIKKVLITIFRSSTLFKTSSMLSVLFVRSNY